MTTTPQPQDPHRSGIYHEVSPATRSPGETGPIPHRADGEVAASQQNRAPANAPGGDQQPDDEQTKDIVQAPGADIQPDSKGGLTIAPTFPPAEGEKRQSGAV